MMSDPLVSCLMVTANRVRLVERAVHCLADQRWSNLELVIVDDGDEDCQEILKPYEGRFAIRYCRIEKNPDQLLGALRNISLDLAKGEYCTQWDDDEWYHPDRVAAQVRCLEENSADAVTLRYVLVHLDEPAFLERPFRSDSIDGTCGTILHRRSAFRYPNVRRSEDLAYLEQFEQAGQVYCMGKEYSHLFVRCFHGNNTWDREHFLKRLRKTWPSWFEYVRARYLFRDLFRHSGFQLTDDEAQSTAELVSVSEKLGLFTSS